VDRLHPLPALPGQGDHRQAGQRGEQGGAVAAGAEHQRRADDRRVELQPEQGLIGEPLAAQVGGLVVAWRIGDAERRDLDDAADAGEGGAAKQLDRAVGVHPLEARRGRWHEDADAVDDGVDAPRPKVRGPVARRPGAHEVERHRVAAGGVATGRDDVMAAPAQRLHDRTPDATAGTANQDVHILARRARTASIAGPRTREIDLRWRAKTR